MRRYRTNLHIPCNGADRLADWLNSRNVQVVSPTTRSLSGAHLRTAQQLLLPVKIVDKSDSRPAAHLSAWRILVQSSQSSEASEAGLFPHPMARRHLLRRSQKRRPSREQASVRDLR